MKKIFFALILVLFLFDYCSASYVVPAAVPAQTRIKQGGELFFTLYFYNTSNEDKEVKLQKNLECFLTTDSKFISTNAVSLEEIESQNLILKTNEFKIVNYRLNLPASVQGEIRISTSLYPEIEFSVISVKASEFDKKSYKTYDSILHLYQPYLENLTPYKPIYFLIGADPKDSKFQLSFKYRILDNDSRTGQKYPWLKGFHFGYTQTSFWDLKSESIPFKDTSYKPEFFFISPNIMNPEYKKFRFFMQTGLQHESNGRDNDESRSTNFFYIKPMFLFFADKSPYGLLFSPKIWTYVNNEDDTNSDLPKYRGYFELDLTLGKADSFLLESSFYRGSKGGSVIVDFYYPMHKIFNNFDIYFQAQYTNALAESLLHYQERNESIRFGFAIVR
ncbi:MAG: phospholipase A [Desulforegulaceae bacterium]|nr:phospholipase A [Desulforegulaceae bacterium]